MAGKIVALIATFALPLFLARFLTKDEYGIYSQFYILTGFCAFVFSLGIQSNIYFFFPKSDEKEKKSLVLQTLLLLLLFSLFAIIMVNIPFFWKYLAGKGELGNYAGFVSFGILFTLPAVIIEPLYVAKKDNFTSLLYPPAVVVLRLILVAGFALWWNSLESVLYGIIVSGLIGFLFVLWYTLRETAFKEMRNLIDLGMAGKQLRYSLPFGLALILNTLAMQFDKIICISFLTPAAFATYSVAFYGIPGVEQVYQSLSQVYLMKMSGKYHENKPDEISAIYKSLVTKTYSFSIPAIMLVSLYAKRIIVMFFTDKYLDAVPLFRVYIFSFLVFMLGAGLILRATGKTMTSLKAYLLSGIFTLPMTWFLIRYWGIWGGMTGAMVSILAPKSIQLYYEMKLIKSDFRHYFPWKQFAVISLIAGMMIIPFAVMEYFFNFNDLIIIVLGGLYLLLVSLIEIRYNVFVFDQSAIENMIRRIPARIGKLIYRPVHKSI